MNDYVFLKYANLSLLFSDESKVKTKLSSILMRTKLDFSCDDDSRDSREAANAGVRVLAGLSVLQNYPG